MEELKGIEVCDADMIMCHRKIKEVGLHCYTALKSWQCGNRYQFRTVFVKDKAKTAAQLLEEFYYYWRNYKTMTAGKRGQRGSK